MQLIIMRHAKSDWGDRSLSDHERPLNPRGRRDSPRMARWLSENGLVPGIILSSSSQRTRDTVELMLPIWDDEPAVIFTDDLYLATPLQIVEVVQEMNGGHESIMVLAHNPGVTSLASVIAGQSLEMPTAAVAAYECNESSEISPESFWQDWTVRASAFQDEPKRPLHLTHFMRPKALGDS